MRNQHELHITQFCCHLPVLTKVECVINTTIQENGKLFVEYEEVADCTVLVEGEKLFKKKLHLIMNYNKSKIGLNYGNSKEIFM